MTDAIDFMFYMEVKLKLIEKMFFFSNGGPRRADRGTDTELRCLFEFFEVNFLLPIGFFLSSSYFLSLLISVNPEVMMGYFCSVENLLPRALVHAHLIMF